MEQSNTEMKNHASSKHGKANYEECFEGAEAHAKALSEKMVKGGGNSNPGVKSADGLTKAERKKKAAAGLDDLLGAGLMGAKSSKKK